MIINEINPLLLTDGYKTSHHQQYPKGTTCVYSNFTARSNKYAPKGCEEIVSFGQQMVFMQIHEMFEKNFFSKPKNEVCEEIKKELSMYLETEYNVSHFEQLHDLGFLPIQVKSIEEGALLPFKIPVLTIRNTHKDFYWITNYLETIISNLLWKPITSATIAYRFRKLIQSWNEKTDKSNISFTDFQAHDFSMRGLDSVGAVISSGLGHLTSFYGTDSLPVIYGARKYYREKDFICSSVPATEHSVMCAGGKYDERKTFKRLLQTYPNGILSIVSDTWDLWNVLTNILPSLKEDILARDGKFVIRPDSGNPVDILCGTTDYKNIIIDLFHGHAMTRLGVLPTDMTWDLFGKTTFESKEEAIELCNLHMRTPQEKGVIELLWETFGGHVNEQGYKVLNSHIGAIYGDSITPEVAEQICSRLEKKGFATTNVVFGIGSYTYQYNTRDTFGFATKATYVSIDGLGREIFKDPITDDGIKKSAKGLLSVQEKNGKIELIDSVDWKTENTGLLKTIYEDGVFYNQTTLDKIRKKLKNQKTFHVENK